MQVLKESVKKAILNGAILEFFEHGYQNANMRRIADSANITVGNIYRYFENKEALFNAVLAPAKRALDDLESFDTKLHTTRVENQNNATQIPTFVVNVLSKKTREIFIMIFNANGSHYQQVKSQLESLVVTKVKEFFPGMFSDYFLKIVAASFIQALFVVFKDNVNDIKKIQDMIVQLIVFHFRDLSNRLF